MFYTDDIINLLSALSREDVRENVGNIISVIFLHMNTTIELVNQFIDWTQWKMSLNHSKLKSFPKKKEIWWASLGQNVGVEINGKNRQFERPVLVLKVFNKESVFVVALTSQKKVNNFFYTFVDSIGVRTSASISQLRTISTKRMDRKISEISNEDFKKVLLSVQSIIFNAETSVMAEVSSEPIQGFNVAEVSHGTSSELPNG